VSVKRFFALLVCLGALSGVFAKVSFSGLDLAEDNRLLFRAESSGGGNAAQNALFRATLDAGGAAGGALLSQLTAFPEKMELVGNNTLLVHGAFGVRRLPLDGGLPGEFSGFPSFTGGSSSGALSSPDGRWLLFVEAKSYARGELVLLDGRSGERVVAAVEAERPGRTFPAVWSGDSRGFIYEKAGRLYFYTINSAAPPPREELRYIGEGTISSIRWEKGAYFYMKGSNVYRVRGEELFARTLYAGLLEPGEVAGRIPFEFDSAFDSFWIAPDERSILLCKGGRNLFYYPLGIDEFTPAPQESLPYVTARQGARINAFWSSGGIITVLIAAGSKTGDEIVAYRLNTAVSRSSFQRIEAPPSFNAALSPSGNKLLVWGNAGLFLYDYAEWKARAQLLSVPVYSVLWLSENECVAGGSERVERLVFGNEGVSARKLLCLSSIAEHGFEQTEQGAGRRIFARSGGAWFSTDGENPWVEFRVPVLRNASLVSPQFRVYLEARNDGYFANIPMVRNVVSVGTFPLIPRLAGGFPLPAGLRHAGRVESEIPLVFSHGLRGSSAVALCFDLYDDAAGLSQVLDVLSRYGVTATFFLNGEFIRRNAEAVRELAASGQECGSMFYTTVDLSDSRIRVDTAFIARGLARNEDDFYRAGKSELGLLWHPPYYSVSGEIAAAAAAAGYRTVGRDVDPGDWITAADAKRMGADRLSASDMIDRVMDAKQGGSIIPVRLGLLPGGNNDYLFNHIEVLLDGLLGEGYELVPVSALMGRSLP
jgi:peptidoglycan/xylan/chitin deacetylase (PgdA/CDA1 family)